jgi:hypothetical protein
MSAETIAIAVLLGIVLMLTFAWWRARHRVGRRNRRRQSVASAGEVEAEALLAAEGFQILERQVTERWRLEIDGEPYDVHCRADLLVRARSRCRFPRGSRFVAEVKTGTRAIDPTHPATRRQLMEYLHVFDVDGVLLIDMRHRRVHHVQF